MKTGDGKRSGRRIRSVEIAINIIEFLQENEGATITQASNELGHSKSTIHSHLHTLEEQKIVVQDYNGYRLSLRVLDISNNVREQVGNYEVIKKEVESLAEELGEIGHFGLEEHGQVSYLYKATGEKAVETASQVGTQQPIYSTSLGKTILAYLPESHRENIIDSTDLKPITPSTIVEEEELRNDLEQIRDWGYGIDDQENIKGLRCVAAPVLKDDIVRGAISISGPASRFTDDRLHGKLADSVKRAANIIELNTKFS